jgi:hypothetical protein
MISQIKNQKSKSLQPDLLLKNKCKDLLKFMKSQMNQMQKSLRKLNRKNKKDLKKRKLKKKS